MKLIFLKGIPGSGKSTWAKEQVAKDPHNWVRVNKDDIRKMMGTEFSKSNEHVTYETERSCVTYALSRNKNVIVDNTHFGGDHEEFYKTLASIYMATFEIKEFRTPVETCLERNSLREFPVPEDRMLEMAKKSGWYPEYFEPKAPFTEGLPYCVVVDIDGTVAKMTGRSPYDYSRVSEDVPNEPVCGLVRMLMLNNVNIVFVSGRPDSCEADTMNWINDNVFKGVEYFMYYLHMRKTGDKRKDFIVKEEIYREKVFPKYNVRFVLDDRKQVVDHLRSMGLIVLQVAEGDF